MATTALPLQPSFSSPTTNATTASIQTSSPNNASYIPRGPVRVPLNYYKAPADGSKPYNFVEKQPEGVAQSNFSAQEIDTDIQDIRGNESLFTLDRNAFASVINVPSEEKDFTDDEHIKAVYYPEVESLILNHVPGAKRVLLFDHTIRRSTQGADRTPVTRVHIDQTAASSKDRVLYHLPDEAETLLEGRYRIINVWRPLNGPVQTSPLAFADASTISEDDIIGVEHRYPHRTGETAAVKYNKNMNWHYLSGMENHERLFLQCFDSENQSIKVPHTAFTDPRSPEGAVGRESIEVRALVFG